MDYSIKKKVMPIGKHKGKTMYYAEANRGRVINFEEVVADISEMSSLTTGDVRNAIDRIAYYLKRELVAGNTIRLGQIETFKLVARGAYKEDPIEVDADTVKKPRLRIIANGYLRSAANQFRVNVDNPYRRDKQKPQTPPSSSPGGTEGQSSGGGSSEHPNLGL
ncbi:HU family DNA-binding protein [Porphyromonas sp. COT-239 OH1446]|uniref:HU family DNA-binding protein n=1 Tax=Porphyromonas sp. COT-239 OH1446 TaxID=1515613 RepID=UPI00052C9B3A|nr:HU family DNA-binding protein [Porphyromonas sp. COT-239 OH1446]KGN71937.1 histidinol phosphate aminotransferase [Porphyromonas sp. COT-239 OH1446]